jgi:indolepyruvate ferredoxin oxidoreductase beta subunit
MSETTTDIVFAGIGGQGVLKASDICAAAAFAAGLDVKKAEVHGMSQRGGSVRSDVRFGESVASPMVPDGAADFLVILDDTQIELNRPALAPAGVLIQPSDVADVELPNKRALNVALCGVLARKLGLDMQLWLDAIAANLPEPAVPANQELFRAVAENG